MPYGLAHKGRGAHVWPFRTEGSWFRGRSRLAVAAAHAADVFLEASERDAAAVDARVGPAAHAALVDDLARVCNPVAPVPTYICAATYLRVAV